MTSPLGKRATDDQRPPIAAPTPGPWAYVPSTKDHGPYVTSQFGNTICDCYAMSNPSSLAVCNGGTSEPQPYMAEMADPNARLIAAAPEMLAALREIAEGLGDTGSTPGEWRTLMTEIEAWVIAKAAIAKATGAKP